MRLSIPYLAIPGAVAGYYFGGKSGPFEPSAQDYQPFRNAFQQYQRGANRDLRQGVNAIGQQSSQRAASQGLYGSPLGQSIIQNNQNYALNTGLENINQNRYQFEQGLAQQQFTDQRAYDQQMQAQNIGTLQNLAFNALPIFNQYFRKHPQEDQIKSGLQTGLGDVAKIAAGITQGAQVNSNPNALPPTPDSHSAQRALTDPAGLGATSSARNANMHRSQTSGGGGASPSATGQTSQSSGDGSKNQPAGNISDPSIAMNAPEGLAADAIEPGLGKEIAEFFGSDLFDIDSAIKSNPPDLPPQIPSPSPHVIPENSIIRDAQGNFMGVRPPEIPKPELHDPNQKGQLMLFNQSGGGNQYKSNIDVQPNWRDNEFQANRLRNYPKPTGNIPSNPYLDTPGTPWSVQSPHVNQYAGQPIPDWFQPHNPHRDANWRSTNEVNSALAAQDASPEGQAELRRRAEQHWKNQVDFHATRLQVPGDQAYGGGSYVKGFLQTALNAIASGKNPAGIWGDPNFVRAVASRLGVTLEEGDPTGQMPGASLSKTSRWNYMIKSRDPDTGEWAIPPDPENYQTPLEIQQNQSNEIESGSLTTPTPNALPLTSAPQQQPPYTPNPGLSSGRSPQIENTPSLSQPTPSVNQQITPQSQVNPFTSAEPGSVYTEQIATDLIKFGENGAVDAKYSSKTVVDPTSGYNVGWGRSITYNGLDVQNELIPMLRASYPNDFQIQEKLRILGIKRDHKGHVTMTPAQFNQLFPFGINETQATMLLNNDIGRSQTELNGIFGDQQFYGLDPQRQAVLIDMMHTLGNNKFRKFSKMIAAINAGNYYEAAYEMRNSLWYKQVGPRRANPLIAKMIGDVFNAQDRKQFNQRLGQGNFESGVSSPPTSGIGFGAGLPLGTAARMMARAVIGASSNSDTSVGRFRAIEQVENTVSLNETPYFSKIVDQIDWFSRQDYSKNEREVGKRIGMILDLEKNKEINSDEALKLINYMRFKLPENDFFLKSTVPREKWELYLSGVNKGRTMPVQTDNELVGIGQKYLGLDEHYHISRLRDFFDRMNVEDRLPNSFENIDDTGGWCSSYVDACLEEGGFGRPKDHLWGLLKRNWNDYAKIGKAGKGDVGDIMLTTPDSKTGDLI